MTEVVSKPAASLELLPRVGEGLSPTSIYLPVGTFSVSVPAFATLSREEASHTATPEPTDIAVIPDPEADPVEQKTRRFLNREVGRRIVIKGALALGGLAIADIATVYHVDSVIEKRLPPGPPTFTWITTYKPGIHNEVMIFFPGTGDLDSLKSARMLRRQADLKNTPLAALTMSHEHTTRDQIRELLHDNLGTDPPQYLSSIGKSWGGLEGLIDTAFVANEIGAKIGRFSMISSPSSIKDASFGEVLAFFEKWTPDTTIVNYNFAAFIDYCREGFWPIIPNIGRAGRVLMHSEDPNGTRSQLHMLRTAHIGSTATFKMLQQATEVGVTKGSYVSAKDPKTDPTVHDRHAYATLNPIMKKLGIPFPWIPGDFSGHAKMGPSIDAMGSWFKDTNPGGKIILASK